MAPSQRTMEPLMKFLPLTVRVKSGFPAMAEAGLTLVMTGTGELTLTWTVWLAVSVPLNAVRMNSVVLVALTLSVPFLSSPAALPKSGPVISTLVVSPTIDQDSVTLLDSGLPMATSGGDAVKNSIFGVPGSGVGVGAGLTMTCLTRPLTSRWPLDAVST